MRQYTYQLYFENASPADANHYAEELRKLLLNASPDITVQRERTNPLAQDFGSTLILVLGTPAVVAATTAISNWLQLHIKASLTLETPDKKVIVQNITSKDATRLAESLLIHQQETSKYDD